MYLVVVLFTFIVIITQIPRYYCMTRSFSGLLTMIIR